nr:MAG TPA_asm: hypothetical protein [Caudoviricetes sp.]
MQTILVYRIHQVHLDLAEVVSQRIFGQYLT